MMKRCAWPPRAAAAAVHFQFDSYLAAAAVDGINNVISFQTPKVVLHLLP